MADDGNTKGFSDFSPEAQAEIKKLRAENAKHRTRANALEGQVTEMGTQADALKAQLEQSAAKVETLTADNTRLAGVETAYNDRLDADIERLRATVPDEAIEKLKGFDGFDRGTKLSMLEALNVVTAQKPAEPQNETPNETKPAEPQNETPNETKPAEDKPKGKAPPPIKPGGSVDNQPTMAARIAAIQNDDSLSRAAKVAALRKLVPRS